jgi:hypothetical protein
MPSIFRVFIRVLVYIVSSDSTQSSFEPIMARAMAVKAEDNAAYPKSDDVDPKLIMAQTLKRAFAHYVLCVLASFWLLYPQLRTLCTRLATPSFTR